MTDPIDLSALIAQWRDLIQRYRAACREANRDGNIELDAYRDGKAAGMLDCIYDLESFTASRSPSSPQHEASPLPSQWRSTADAYAVGSGQREARVYRKCAMELEREEATLAASRSPSSAQHGKSIGRCADDVVKVARATIQEELSDESFSVIRNLVVMALQAVDASRVAPSSAQGWEPTIPKGEKRFLGWYPIANDMFINSSGHPDELAGPGGEPPTLFHRLPPAPGAGLTNDPPNGGDPGGGYTDTKYRAGAGRPPQEK